MIRHSTTQVKALEEQFKKENERLEAELEEARAKKGHHSVIDIDTPAGNYTLFMLCLLSSRSSLISPPVA
jgi:hypothetical protein